MTKSSRLDDDPLLSPKELKEKLPLSRAKIYDLFKTNELTHIRIGDRILVRESVVLKFLEERTVEGRIS
jgi:excisionase family DNA binding protein